MYIYLYNVIVAKINDKLTIKTPDISKTHL